MTDKEVLKSKINSKVNELIEGVSMVGNVNFFEIGIKCVNGDITFRLENTYKEKVK
ncbi:hypothetical protein IAI10_13200 [Clostridium sp. 19966]|uniref:hypothetical protein n=1 Tax=Clostridium sp. 19966 TaxID=2768166 RepID=UPI0028DE59A5|nr:hypothetical protein [Clostridium sp. 19966]MDT8717623.1 hypothetical protein [Clostridium sp. 19966]